MLLGLNQLLLYKNGKHILIDTGLGEKWRRDETGLLDYQLPRRLPTELSRHNVNRDEIDIVILTHLHYDHSGGATVRAGDLFSPAFPNAEYFVQREELTEALNPPTGREEDYRNQDFQPLLKAGVLRAVEGVFEVTPGVTLHLAPGHSRGHQIVKIDLEGETLLYAGDLISTRTHANLQYTMIYDQNREQVLVQRAVWLKRSIENGWKVVLCHAYRDPIWDANLANQQIAL